MALDASGRRGPPRSGCVEPFVRPRRLTETAILRRYEQGRPGECYEYAFRELFAWSDAGRPEPAMVVVHGMVGGAAGYGHAWVERGGFAYDWQTFALHGSAPVPVREFYARHLPVDCTTYTVESVAANVVREGHHGPWEGAK